MGWDLNLYVEYKDKDGKWQLDKEGGDCAYGISRKNHFFGLCIPEYEKYMGIFKDASNSYNESISSAFEPHVDFGYTLKELKEIDWPLEDGLDDSESEPSKEYKEFIIKLEEFSMQYGGDENVRILYYYTG